MRCEVGTHSTQPALVTKRMASAPQHKYVVRLTLEWITKLLRSVALVGPGRRAPAVEALGAQAVLLYMANFSAFELTQPQLLRFRWSPRVTVSRPIFAMHTACPVGRTCRV